MIFGHIFGKDSIDIHEQIYGTLNLSMYRSYPQSDLSVTFFLKSYHIKSIVTSATKFLGFFPEILIFLIYFGLKSCFSCEHDAWHYLIKF